MDTHGYLHQRATVEKIKAVAITINTCRFSTHTSGNTSLKTLNVDDNGMLWFFNLSAQAVNQDDMVKIVYYNQKDTYMSISGHADVFDGNQLIRVHPENVLYWDSNSRRMIPLLNDDIA